MKRWYLTSVKQQNPDVRLIIPVLCFSLSLSLSIVLLSCVKKSETDHIVHTWDMKYITSQVGGREGNIVKYMTGQWLSAHNWQCISGVWESSISTFKLFVSDGQAASRWAPLPTTVTSVLIFWLLLVNDHCFVSRVLGSGTPVWLDSHVCEQS